MTNLLNLPELTAELAEDLEHEYVFKATVAAPPAFCLRCGCIGAKLYNHGSKVQLFRDTPMHGKRVLIRLTRLRYRCLECQQTFMEPLACVDERRMGTRRLTEYIARRCFKQTFVSVADEVGVDDKTVRNVFQDHLLEWQRDYRAATPMWMGIDEIHILGRPCAVITNIEERTLVDILPDRNIPTLEKWLDSRRDELWMVGVVTMDMYRPYRSLIQAMCPHAAVVIDKFHVVRMASGALDQIRRETGKALKPAQKRQLMRERSLLLARNRELNMKQQINLDTWLDNFPDLRVAQEASELFYAVYEPADRAEAVSRYQKWRAFLSEAPEAVQAAFKPLLTASTNWQSEIMNYFDNHRLTNAYTEALNGVIRVTNRMGRGYSFEVLRARLLYEKEAVKTVPWPNGRSRGRMAELMVDTIETYLPGQSPGSVLGTSLSTLVKILEEGQA